VVVCSSQQEAAQPQQSKAELEKAMKEAIAAEDYAAAAKLKEQIWNIEMQDPLTSLKLALDGAIAEERYDVGSS
jgi:protein-arginine kinase activator protein McsA